MKEIVGSSVSSNLRSALTLKKVQFFQNCYFRFIEGCVTSKETVTQALDGCEAVMHFAGLKAVGESNVIPLDYYRVNVAGTINLLQVSLLEICVC